MLHSYVFGCNTINGGIAFPSDDEFKVGCDWTRAAFSSSGHYISVGSSDGTVFIFNAATTKVEHKLKEHRYVSHYTLSNTSVKSYIYIIAIISI